MFSFIFTQMTVQAGIKKHGQAARDALTAEFAQLDYKGAYEPIHAKVREFRQPLQVQIHLEMPGILVQLGHIQRT